MACSGWAELEPGPTGGGSADTDCVVYSVQSAQTVDAGHHWQTLTGLYWLKLWLESWQEELAREKWRELAVGLDTGQDRTKVEEEVEYKLKDIYKQLKGNENRKKKQIR